ncbi:MAG: hypothetical protein ACP5OC_04765 [Thermoplasmata archaeon]
MKAEKNVLAGYFASVRELPEILDSGETYSLVDGSRKSYFVAPLSTVQLKILTGMTEDRILSILPEIRINDHSGLRIYDPGSLSFSTSPGQTIPNETTREDLIKLTIYAITRKLGENGGRAAKVDEVVFQLKNDAGIPDDFMPSSLMEMVEGRPLSDPESLLDNLQPSFSEGMVFPLFRIAGEAAVSVGFLACNPAAFPDQDKLKAANLISLVRSEFVSFTSDPIYKDFVAGRILRSVVFNMERKKTRKLGKPLFDDTKIEALMRIGIVEKTEGSFCIKEILSLDQIKKLASEYEEKNHQIAMEWKAKRIKLP